MYTFPTAVINHVTYTAVRWAQFPTIVYDISNVDVVAGSEIVVVADDLSTLTVFIQDGVSTNLQIKTAINNSITTVNSLFPRDLVTLVIAGGHNSDTNTTASTAMSGAVNTGARFEPGTSVPPILSVDPITPAEGYVWYNATSHLVKYFDGTAIKTVATV